MIARVRLLLLALVLPALLAGAVLQWLAAREALREQLRQRNQDAAAMLALALSQLPADDPGLTEMVIAAQFDTGHYRSIMLRDGAGRPLADRRGEASPARAPGWFADMLPLAVPAGTAEVSQGWRPVGRLEVQAHTAWAYDALWSALLRAGGLVAALGAAALLVAGVAMRAWARPLAATVAQARALQDGRFVFAAEPAIPELRLLTRSMNSLVARLRDQFAAQAAEVEHLRRQAHVDAVTGLPHRRHALSLLEAALAQSGEAASALLIVRVRDLAAMNARLGHDTVDRLLAALGEGLHAYPARVDGAFCGRLNGSDFLLYLPRGGVALETAESLRGVLRAALQRVDPSADLAIGGVDGQLAGPPARVLAQADLALARAEAAGPFGLEVEPLDVADVADVAAAGATDWHRQIAAALAAGRVSLGAHPVRDRDGTLLMQDCPLRLQLHGQGPFEPAARWLPMAERYRMTPQVDLTALDLALRAIARDGAARRVHMAAASVANPGFVTTVAARLAAAPAAAAALWIEVPESAASGDTAGLAEAAALWRMSGARVGLGHAGDALGRLPPLPSLGLDFVKLDARHLRGLARDERLRGFARGLAGLVRPLGLRLHAAGIDDAEDLAALWALGFDAATGPAVT